MCAWVSLRDKVGEGELGWTCRLLFCFVFFRDEVQQTACQLDGMSAFCACARVCVGFFGRLGVCVTCKVKGYCLVEHDEGLLMKAFRA